MLYLAIRLNLIGKNESHDLIDKTNEISKMYMD